ncbi:hypothetical protein [Amycolatopsis magusensis]|uniref:hypothetical protein n=1 Tax=Amycolatopsis magusensis TaxID=882444 RepID=UPI0037A8C5C7
MSPSVRIIRSVHEIDAAQSSELDEATVTEVCERIDQARLTPARESYCTDKIGQRTFEVQMAPYTSPTADGQRWAVYTSDNLGAAYLDTADRATAEARYDDEVRALAACADDSMYAWWDVTDLDGLAQTRHDYTVEARRDGEQQWTACGSGSHDVGSHVDEPTFDAAAAFLVEQTLPDRGGEFAQARVRFRVAGQPEPVATELIELPGDPDSA